MEDIYTFSRRKYEAAQFPEPSLLKTTENLAKTVLAILRLTILGSFLLIKSLVFLFLPTPCKSIQDQVALITGGANGIGRALGIELAKCGCRIAVADVDIDGARDACEELEIFGAKALPYECDVSEYDQVVALKEKIKCDLGDVDILINNVGLLTKISLNEGEPEDILRIFKVNLISHFWTIRVFMPEMIKRKRGHIVAVASMLAVQPSARAICYSATKFGVHSLMDGLSELIKIERLGLNLSTIYPPWVLTRKEVIDEIIACDGFSPTSELFIYTPSEVAKVAIDGILKNKKHIFVPSYLKPLMKTAMFLPIEFQEMIRENFKLYPNSNINTPRKWQQQQQQ